MTVKNVAELANASAMFVVARAKSNTSGHIQRSPLGRLSCGLFRHVEPQARCLLLAHRCIRGTATFWSLLE